MKKKTLALLAALVLVIGCIIGGTLAWLTAKTDAVVNTFSTSDIKIELKEDTGTVYKMIPGYTISKDPKVTVLAGSEKCYLFVKLEKSQNFDTYLEYAIADGWMQGNGTDIPKNVYYRVVEASDSDQAFDVIKDNQVTVKDTVTKEQMNALDAEGVVKPTLTITAYASQLHKNATETFDPATAWSNIANK